MRLYEFDGSFVDNLTSVLRNQIGRGDSKKQPQTFTYAALNQLMKNVGSPIHLDQQTLTTLRNNNPDLDSLISNFDNDTISLGTKVQPQDKNNDLDIDAGDLTGPSVDQMARKGVRDHYRDISK